MGGLVALEVAQQLHAEGEEVAALVLIDTSPPAHSGDPSGARGAADDARLLLFAHDLGLPPVPPASGEPPGEQTDEALARLLARGRGRRISSARPGPGAASSAPVPGVPRPARGAIARYRVRPFAGRIDAAAGRPDRDAGSVAAGRTGVAPVGPRTALDHHLIPGDHYTIVRQPHVRALAERLARCPGGGAPVRSPGEEMEMRDRLLAGYARQLGHPAGGPGHLVAALLDRANRATVVVRSTRWRRTPAAARPTSASAGA